MPTLSPTNDLELLQSLKATPPQSNAVRSLRDLLRTRLHRALSHREGVSDADIDDYAQDATIRVLATLDTFQHRSRFSTWATSVALRVAMTDLRRRRWGDRTLVDVLAAPTENPDDPSLPAEHTERLARLRHAVDHDLTERQRAAILGELAGMPTRILAEQLGMTPNALYKLHHDARRKLRVALNPDQHRPAESLRP